MWTLFIRGANIILTLSPIKVYDFSTTTHVINLLLLLIFDFLFSVVRLPLPALFLSPLFIDCKSAAEESAKVPEVTVSN